MLFKTDWKASTRLNGDIRAKRLTVEDGVTFVGKSEVNPSGPVQRGGHAAGQKPTPDQTPQANSHEEDPGKQKGGLFNKK